MFKWTKDFERDRHIHEDRLMPYKEKLIWEKSSRDIEREVSSEIFMKNHQEIK